MKKQTFAKQFIITRKNFLEIMKKGGFSKVQTQRRYFEGFDQPYIVGIIKQIMPSNGNLKEKREDFIKKIKSLPLPTICLIEKISCVLDIDNDEIEFCAKISFPQIIKTNHYHHRYTGEYVIDEEEILGKEGKILKGGRALYVYNLENW